MRTTKTIMVEKEVTTCTCDICGTSTDNNSGCCGFSRIMSCDFCGQDCCNDCRHAFWERDWEDYHDVLSCSDCLPKATQAWDVALQIAGRGESIRDATKEVFNNLDQYKHMI